MSSCRNAKPPKYPQPVPLVEDQVSKCPSLGPLSHSNHPTHSCVWHFSFYRTLPPVLSDVASIWRHRTEHFPGGCLQIRAVSSLRLSLGCLWSCRSGSGCIVFTFRDFGAMRETNGLCSTFSQGVPSAAWCCLW